jgi:hypothetical protein
VFPAADGAASVEVSFAAGRATHAAVFRSLLDLAAITCIANRA